MDRRLIAALIAVPVLAGGAWWFKSRSAVGNAAEKVQYKLSPVEVGEVKKTVSATGTLQAWRVVDIKARAGGELAFLGVDVGSEVRKDQVLAKIDPLDVQLTLNQARADVTSSKAREAQSGKTYQLTTQQSSISVRDAEAGLRSAAASKAASEANVKAAETRLATARQQADAQPKLTGATIASAKASYEQAMTQRRQLDATTKQQRASAQAGFNQAQANRENARLVLERNKALLGKGFVAQSAVDSATAALEVADANVLTSKTRLDTIDVELRTSIEAADARVEQTKAAYEQAQAGSVDIQNRRNSALEAEAALAQSQAALGQVTAALARAEATLEQAKAQRINNDIRRFDIDANKASIARAEASKFNAETALSRTVIRAPMDGVVLQKFVEQGTIIASALGFSSQGTNLVQIGDVSRMYVDVAVDETDIASVDIGQTVDVSVEAYPGIPFEGKVIRIDPQAVVLQNVTSVHVRVEVDNTAPTFRLLKPAMNATCEFVMDKVESAIKVPNEAIREDNEGKYVEIGTGGKTPPPDPKTGQVADPDALIDVKLEKVKITIGVEGNDATEVKESDGSKIKEGVTIVTQTIEPVAPTAGGSPFGGGMGGMRGMGGGGGRR
ncbi:MAG: efflux RND transporter periplasmic adaptor subunit [Armatimonadota bacterium]